METEKRNNEEVQKSSDIGVALDSVIHHVGEMGVYQRLLFVGMLPFGFSWAFVYFSQMFITATPQEHWCHVPELGELSVELRRNLSIPGAAEGLPYDHCSMFNANYTLVLETLMPPSGAPTVDCQNGWEFLLEDIPYQTVVSERGWVCGRATLAPLAQVVFFMGSIAGGVVSGLLADAYGRVPALMLTNMLGCLGGVATVFSRGFWDFALCRFVVGMACDGVFLMMYILVLEYVGTRHRTWVANASIALFFGGGCLTLPWIALAVSDWQLLMLATSLPMLVVVAAPWLIPESTRWLVSKGRVDKAVKILRRFEKLNGTKIPDDVLDNFVLTAKSSQEKEESAFILFKTPSVRSMLINMIVVFMSVGLVFDGLVRLSENLGLDFFVTFTVSSITEIPSVALVVLLLDRFGRRKLVFAPLVFSGFISLVTAFVPRGVISVSLAVIARFFANMSYVAVIQFNSELLPTSVRASGASFVHLSSFAALMLSPFIVFSERAWLGLPLIIMAAVALIGGCAALLLPETAGRPMPQTLADGQRLANARPYRRKRAEISTNPVPEEGNS